MKDSCTLYVGNLSFFTTETQILENFSRAGPVKRVIMGLNRETKTPCGFCFVEYYTRESAYDCLKCISGTMCDGQIIRCELDAGFKPGRQFGRGQSGGQVRDERRQSHDPARGGPIQIQQPHSDGPINRKRGRENYGKGSWGESDALRTSRAPPREIGSSGHPIKSIGIEIDAEDGNELGKSNKLQRVSME